MKNIFATSVSILTVLFSSISKKSYNAKWLIQERLVDLIEDDDDGDGGQNALDEPRFHNDGRLVDAFLLEKMMQRRDEEELSLEISFPEYLKEARREIDDEQSEEDDEWDDDAHPHIEQIEQRSYQSSERERAAIAHEDLGGMDVVEHECYEHGDDDRDHRRRDVGLVEEEDHGQDEKDDGHKPACEPV